MSTHVVKFYTDKQLEVEKWINNFGFRTQLEVSFGKYCVDIYIPELNWVVEIDGPWHWKKKDEKRDKILCRDYGVKTILHVSVGIRKEEFEQIFRFALEREIGKCQL